MRQRDRTHLAASSESHLGTGQLSRRRAAVSSNVFHGDDKKNPDRHIPAKQNHVSGTKDVMHARFLVDVVPGKVREHKSTSMDSTWGKTTRCVSRTERLEILETILLCARYSKFCADSMPPFAISLLFLRQKSDFEGTQIAIQREVTRDGYLTRALFLNPRFTRLWIHPSRPNLPPLS